MKPKYRIVVEVYASQELKPLEVATCVEHLLNGFDSSNTKLSFTSLAAPTVVEIRRITEQTN